MYVVDVAGLDPLAQDLVFARVRLEAARAPRAPRPRRRSRRGVRGRAQQVRARRRPRHLRAQDAARPRRARPLPRAGALLGAAVPLPGAAARRRQRRHGGLRAHGHGRARDARLRDALARHQDQARHAAQGRADDPASALHPADLRPLPAPGGAERPRRRRALPAGDRAPVRRRGGAPARASWTAPSPATRSASSWPAAPSATCAAPSRPLAASARPTCAATSGRSSAVAWRRRWHVPARRYRRSSRRPIRTLKESSALLSRRFRIASRSSHGLRFILSAYPVPHRDRRSACWRMRRCRPRSPCPP